MYVQKEKKKMISSQREINQRQREITEHVCRRTFTELSINRSLASRRDIQGRKSKDDVGISRYRYTRERKREGGERGQRDRGRVSPSIRVIPSEGRVFKHVVSRCS